MNIPLDPKVKRGLAALDFKRPTDIQFRSIHSILKGEDLLAIAQTGTGKTAAFCDSAYSLNLYQKEKAKAEVRCHCSGNGPKS